MTSSAQQTPGRRDAGAVVPPDVYGPAVNALRFLAVDAINRANSGHPGTPLDIAPVIYRLYTHQLRHDPANPDWFDRDRFVLSGGHASMVLYGALHLSGYDLTLDDLASFRQLGSRCAGHPERGLAPGVEVTTGPLGQGLSNAVGMALAERLLAARFNRDGYPVIDHCTIAECGDGDLMEGVASEAGSLAGHLGLGKLTVIYDDNRVSLDGPTAWTFTEEVATRFLGYGWHVVRLFDIDDLAAVDAALDEARAETERPSIIVVHSHIGIGTPIHDDHKAHGSPVGPEYAAVARELLRWPHPPFEIPDDVYATWRSQVAERAAARAEWLALVERYRESHPELADELDRASAGRLPNGLSDRLPRFEPGQRISTREAAGETLRALAGAVPEIVGGAADVESSTKTHLDGYPDVDRHDWSGRTIHFGVREHAMGAVVNGMAAHGGLRPFGATFFCFSDYMRPALRLSAIMSLPCVWVFTHDSIGLGEDGPEWRWRQPARSAGAPWRTQSSGWTTSALPARPRISIPTSASRPSRRSRWPGAARCTGINRRTPMLHRRAAAWNELGLTAGPPHQITGLCQRCSHVKARLDSSRPGTRLVWFEDEGPFRVLCEPDADAVGGMASLTVGS